MIFEDPDTHDTGPLAWMAILAVTCLALFLFQKVLWLVVPFLFALILYYLLASPVQWLVYRGFTLDASTGMVMGVFVAAMVSLCVLGFPWLAQHALDWQHSFDRYVQGGILLVDRTLIMVESHWSVLADADISSKVAAKMKYWSSNFATEQIEAAILGAGTWLPIIFLVPFITFFMLRDGRRFKHFISDAVPNAFFEKTLFLLHEVDRTTRAYFQGLIKLTVLDTLTLGLGLAILGLPLPLLLSLICAILAWIPFVGSIIGGVFVVMVAATDFPGQPGMAYATAALFVVVRMIDDFIYMPMTVGKNLHMHPLMTVLMIFVGGAIAGVSGLMLVLPLLGVIMVVGGTIGEIINDPRLMARHRNAMALQKKQASADLTQP